MKKRMMQRILGIILGMLIALTGCQKQTKEPDITEVPEALEESREDTGEKEEIEEIEKEEEEENTEKIEREVVEAEIVQIPDGQELSRYKQYQLKDIPLITDSIASGSFGFDALDIVNTCEDKPIVKVPKSGCLVIRNWNASDLSAYQAGGEISFMLKGAGAKSVTIGLQDHVLERKPVEITSNITIEEFSTEWTKVSIPLADFFAQTPELNAEYLWTIRISTDGEAYLSNMIISSEDAETVYPVIKVNQVGYKPMAEKVALASGFREILSVEDAAGFQLITADTREIVYEGTMIQTSIFDTHSGESVYKMDFSAWQEEGEYQIVFTDNSGVTYGSVPFVIGEEVYDQLLSDVCRYYYFQRANVELEEKYAGEWARKGLYMEDYNMSFLSGNLEKKDVSGGWFDAGDFGKYVDTGATTVNDLLWAYYFFAEEFTDGQNNIPESGNGIPDLLDEVKVELEFILKMQDKDGGFYHRVNPDDSSRRIVDTFGNGNENVKSTPASASCSAVLAFASVFFREFDETYADVLLDSAEKGWNYIEKNPNISSAGTYGTNEKASQKLWAACSLYYATGKTVYHDYIQKHVNDFTKGFDIYSYGHSAERMQKMAYFTYLLSDNTSTKVTKVVDAKYTAWRKAMVECINKNPWGTALETWAYWWGSNANALSVAMELYIGDSLCMENTEEAVSYAQSTFDYILGKNPLALSYVTGEGDRSISCTFSGIFGEDGKTGFPPGYMPGGVNSYDNWVVSAYPAKCYADNSFDWVSNENAIGYNAPLVFVAALCNQDSEAATD